MDSCTSWLRCWDDVYFAESSLFMRHMKEDFFFPWLHSSTFFDAVYTNFRLSEKQLFASISTALFTGKSGVEARGKKSDEQRRAGYFAAGFWDAREGLRAGRGTLPKERGGANAV